LWPASSRSSSLGLDIQHLKADPALKVWSLAEHDAVSYRAPTCALPRGTQMTFANELAKQLVGSWRVKTLTIQIVGEEPTQPFGAEPKGGIVITDNGRFTAVVSASNRKPASNNDERAALLQSLIAYTGKFTLDGNRLTTKVDTSWNEVYTGANQNQLRFISLDGDKLTIDAPEQDSLVRPDKRFTARLTFEREK
jgi:hypothetical protein